MKKTSSSLYLWIAALVLSAWCYLDLSSRQTATESSVAIAHLAEEPTSEQEAAEEEAGFYLPDISLLKKALDLAGRLSGFGTPR